MRDPSEILRGPFDIETHKGAFVHYLEVCIDRDGVIRYAVPSHQRWLLERFMDREGIETDLEAWGRIPPYGVIEWLCRELGCIAVWEDRFSGVPNAKQRAALRRLRLAGLYRGSC